MILTGIRTTLNAPLTPFTVVFCHIIANHNDAQDDLQLLEKFVMGLQSARQISEGVEKFYQLCSVFWKVAEAYVRAKNEEAKFLHSSNSMSASNMQNTSWQPAIGELDGYLSALGFAPLLPSAGHSDVYPASSAMETDMSTHLYDWYSGNASLYGLLEQDLSNINGLGMDQNQIW